MPAGQPLLSGHLVCRFRPTPCGQEPPNTSRPHSGVQAHRAHSSPGAPGLLRPPLLGGPVSRQASMLFPAWSFTDQEPSRK